MLLKHHMDTIYFLPKDDINTLIFVVLKLNVIFKENLTTMDQ